VKVYLKTKVGQRRRAKCDGDGLWECNLRVWVAAQNGGLLLRELLGRQGTQRLHSNQQLAKTPETCENRLGVGGLRENQQIGGGRGKREPERQREEATYAIQRLRVFAIRHQLLGHSRTSRHLRARQRKLSQQRRRRTSPPKNDRTWSNVAHQQ
jgi:hypothetical protein